MWETVLALGCATAVACAVWYAVVAWRARHELTVGRPIAIAALGLAVTALPVLRDALHRAGPAPSVLSATGAALLLAGFGSIAVCMADRRLHFRLRHLIVLAEPVLVLLYTLVHPVPVDRFTLPLAVHTGYSVVYLAAVAGVLVRRLRAPGSNAWGRIVDPKEVADACEQARSGLARHP